MTALLLVTAIAWASAAGGGTSVADLVVVAAVLVLALVRGPIPDLPRPMVVGLAATSVWMLGRAAATHADAESGLRVPVLVAVVTVTSMVTARFTEEERTTLFRGLVTVGGVHASIAVFSAAVHLANGRTWFPPGYRSESLLGSANALGFILVAAAAVTTHPSVVRRPEFACVLLVLLWAGVLLTGSRSAISAGILMAVVLMRRLRRLPVLVAIGAGLAVVVARFAASAHEPRGDVWLEALHGLASHPFLGQGPGPMLFVTPNPADRITTHAHDEILQLGVEYGIVGLVLMSATIALALHQGRRPQELSIAMAAFALLASGLFDFSLRVTAVAILAAAMTTCAFHPAIASRDVPWRA